MIRVLLLTLRMLPVVVVLILIAVGLYYLLTKRKTENLAKEILIRIGIWFNLIVGGIFLLLTLYALLDKNLWIVEFFGSIIVVNLVFLAIALIAKHNFLKHRPHYQWKKIKLKQ